MDMLNDHQGTNLCIEDNWDSVFPEVTIIVDGENIESISLPSDDSEDNDYEPEVPEADEMTLNTSSESSSSAESNFTCSLEYLNVSTIGRKLENYGLSSDNSDEYDYHPGKHNHELSDQEGSSCEKSEYSSDSDELDTLKSDNGFLGTEQIVENLNEGKQALDIKKKPSNFELAMLISDLGPQYPLPISGRRRYEKLDYKKLHDETYGNAPSDSSDDEDWTSTTKMNKSAHTRTINVKLEVCKTKSGRKGTPKNFNITEKSLTQTNQEKLDDKGTNHSTCEQHQIYNCHRDAGDKTSKSGQKGFGQEIRQKLRESLKANLYPTRQTKENLAKELGLTVHQVSVWFTNARRNKSLLMNIEISQKHDSTSFDNIPIIKIIAKNRKNSRDLTCSSDMANNETK